MSGIKEVLQLPGCDVCEHPAEYDCMTIYDEAAYLCGEHYSFMGNEGIRLVKK